MAQTVVKNAGFFDGTNTNRAAYVFDQGFVAVDPNYWATVSGRIGVNLTSGFNEPERQFTLEFRSASTKTFKLQLSTACTYRVSYTDILQKTPRISTYAAKGNHDVFDTATWTISITLGVQAKLLVTVTPEYITQNSVSNFVFRLF